MDKKKMRERVNSANPLELIIIIIELIIHEIDRAIAAAPQSTAYDEAINRAKDYLEELVLSLNNNIAFSDDLSMLYLFVNRCLIRSSFIKNNDKNKPLQEARGILCGLHEAWQGLNDKVQKDYGHETAPIDALLNDYIKQNQSFTGLTYGRGGLVDFDDYDPNKGYKV